MRRGPCQGREGKKTEKSRGKCTPGTPKRQTLGRKKEARGNNNNLSREDDDNNNGNKDLEGYFFSCLPPVQISGFFAGGIMVSKGSNWGIRGE